MAYLQYYSAGRIMDKIGIGQAIGPAVAGWLKDFSGTFVDALVLAAVVLLLGAGGAIAMKEISWIRSAQKREVYEMNESSALVALAELLLTNSPAGVAVYEGIAAEVYE